MTSQRNACQPNARPNHVWIIDDDRSIRWVLERALTQAGIQTTCFDTAQGVMEMLADNIPNAIMADIRMPGLDGLQLLTKIVAAYPKIPVIIMTAYSDLESTVAAYREGAFEYLPKPFDVDEAVELIERAVDYGHAEAEAIASPSVSTKGPEIIGSALGMQEVFRAIGRLSRSNVTVLITGESGTGKELIARALHRHGPRVGKPFIALNMAAIPHELLESELFGHERGAFTGAQSRRLGRFEQADGGTLFLDEIGDMPAQLQTRLLRILAEGEFFRVGGHAPIRMDVRIIAATHQNLEQRVLTGSFRDDLFHRINVVRIHTPALRDRCEDVPVLARHFLDLAAKELDVKPKNLCPDVEAFLMRLDWPGNVRQLENICRWLTVMASGTKVRLKDLPPELLKTNDEPVAVGESWETLLQQWAQQRLMLGDTMLLDVAVPQLERTLIRTTLNYTGGRRHNAAKLLGWGRNTLTRKMKEHGITLV
uniref:DNA-binding transcriptional regulator NtrC n=1 Tax=Candidatus Kentrum sp. LFY TaxID=2126342 RepID=A0A450U5M8_9GAMM|nr:MAG: two-component system, NtrC family, nitrogen regulation response regulator GlnG [Candidatus Kentron sp. LFY]VFJ89029.1 MAG: two-component system, NtrC family, nitrogen regulation response regulator GlnG [Candidatus Kentron sp. LFY]VFK13751.1 MAG: two-component system, NtrC family, nitrogen regulation response regulator GlnG [Candidatus Kentron sp. LFY]